jgi:hypothetical protein
LRNFCIKLDERGVNKNLKQLMESLLIVSHCCNGPFGDIVVWEIAKMVMIF